MKSRSAFFAFSALPMMIVSAQEPIKSEPLKLSLFDAVQTSLKNNLQVGIARNIRAATKANELIQDGAFDFNFITSDNYSKIQSASISNSTIQNSPSTLITTETNSTRKSRSLTATLSKAFIWGGTFQANYLGPNYNSSIVSGTQTITPISSPSIHHPLDLFLQAPSLIPDRSAHPILRASLRGLAPVLPQLIIL